MSVMGYKQIIEHKNDLPEIKTKIVNLSTLCRYKHKQIESHKSCEPDRYYFDITVNGSGLLSAYKHVCYFDNKEKAENIYKELRLKLYDQETKPFLKKIASNHILTTNDKEKIYKIFDKFENLKKIEEVIVYK
jgi:hypothetical protein